MSRPVQQMVFLKLSDKLGNNCGLCSEFIAEANPKRCNHHHCDGLQDYSGHLSHSRQTAWCPDDQTLAHHYPHHLGKGMHACQDNTKMKLKRRETGAIDTEGHQLAGVKDGLAIIQGWPALSCWV